MIKDEINYGLHSTLFFGEYIYNFILDIHKNDIGSIEQDRISNIYYVSLQNDGYYKALKFQEILGEENINVRLRLDYSLFMINRVKGTPLEISLVLGGVFLIISIFTFISFINNMVLSKDESIRIMRSLGTRFKDVNTIFIFQDLFIAFLLVATATTTAYFIGSFINKEIKKNIYVLVPLINPTMDSFNSFYINFH